MKSFAEIQASTDRVVANLVGGNAKKSVSLMLEAGKGAESCRLRHPNAKSLNEAYRLCGGIGKVPDIATQTRNIFVGLVLPGFLEETAYDTAVVNMFKPASPSLKVLEKHADKFSAGQADLFRAKIGEIIAEKPEDGVKQLTAIKKQVMEIAGLVEDADPLKEFGEMLAKYLTGTEKESALITDDDAEVAYEMVREHATKLVARIHAIAVANESADPTLKAAAA